MTEPAVIEPRICPYLGVAGDPKSRFSYPSKAHLCHAAKPVPIDLAYQTQYCMSGRYESCSRFQRAEVGASPASKSQPTAHRSIGLWAALIVVSVTALASTTLAIAFATGILAPLSGDPGIAAATGSAVPSTVAPVAQPTLLPASPTPAPTATQTAAATPTATATATPSATPAPTATALASPLIHVVQRGETLRSIAALYGVTVVELAEVNGIEDLNLIRLGRELVIPGVEPSPTP